MTSILHTINLVIANIISALTKIELEIRPHIYFGRPLGGHFCFVGGHFELNASKYRNGSMISQLSLAGFVIL
jgi:hypothetical protein